MNKTWVNVIHGAIAGLVVSIALYGPIIMDWTF